jgi:hypothetical protein
MQIIENGVKVYGPYPGQKGRKHVILLSPDGSRKTESYARFLMEQFLGRELLKSEVVHHKDEDWTNDTISNFDIVVEREHLLHHHGPKMEALRKVNANKERVIKHGSLNAALRLKCTCEECLAARRAWNDRRNARRRSTDGPRGSYNAPVECGTTRAYSRGCRCDKCRAAHAASVKFYRDRSKADKL